MKTQPTGVVTVHASTLRSLSSTRADRGWLPVAGAVVISLAVALELIRRRRDRRDRREPVLAPPGVWNTS